MTVLETGLLARRGFLAGGAALGLTACGGKPADKPKAAAKSIQTIADAVAGDWRLPQDRARDKWRHPVESLTFWGLRPGMTVVEFWPGAGWYTDILAPYLAATDGRLYAADLEPVDPPSREIVGALNRRIEENLRLYGDVVFTSFGATSTTPVAPPGSADLVLFLRNVHNWMAAGIAEKAFREAFASLKPGGVLGIEEHRARPGGVQDPLASDGYVQQAYVLQLAQDAGFKLAGASEINANPKDDTKHPFGVWTLPPTRLSAPRGQPAKPGFNHSKYDAIGESDRMTLKLVKPK